MDVNAKTCNNVTMDVNVKTCKTAGEQERSGYVLANEIKVLNVSKSFSCFKKFQYFQKVLKLSLSLSKCENLVFKNVKVGK